LTLGSVPDQILAFTVEPVRITTMFRSDDFTSLLFDLGQNGTFLNGVIYGYPEIGVSGELSTIETLVPSQNGTSYALGARILGAGLGSGKRRGRTPNACRRGGRASKCSPIHRQLLMDTCNDAIQNESGRVKEERSPTFSAELAIHF
jgi:hypothetical protein